MNINSLLNKLSDLEILIELYQRKGITIHFIALTEVRLSDECSAFFNIDNYNAFYCNKQMNSGGVALFCHGSMSCSSLFQMNLSNVDILGVSILSLNLKIIVVYKQPTVNLSNFLPVIDCLLEKYRKCIIVGDLNIDLLKNNTDSLRLSNTIIANGYTILNKIDPMFATRTATRDGSTTHTIIDHALSDINTYKYHLSILPTALSDHNQIFLSFDTNSSNKFITQRNDYVLCRTNFSKFRNLILNNPYLNRNLANSESVNNCLDFIKSQYNSCITKKQFSRCNEKKPWITSHLISLINQRDRYHALLKKYPFNDYIRTQLKYYKSLAEYNRKNARNRYFINIIQKNINNAKKLWAAFNYIIYNKKTDPVKITSIKDLQDRTITNEIEIVNVLNGYFTNVGSTLASNLQLIQNRPLRSTLNRYISNSLFLREFEYDDIISTINALKNKSANNDDIPATIIKRNTDILAPILLKLINASFRNGYFPDNLKIARLVPIHKAGDPTLPSNYRPISILPTISKIFERLLYNVTESFLKKFNVIHKLQFGFQKGSGSLSATSHLVTNLQNALDDPKRKIASGIFIDLQKAFDSIPHIILLEKLSKYGIRGVTLKIFDSYLRNRMQFTALNKSSSNALNVTYGTPQGSNLGPLLFLLYINDIFDLPFKGTIILFADDAVLYYSGFNINEMYANMQHDLNVLFEWLYDNVLSINITKTKYMIFHSDNKKINLDSLALHINNVEIARVDKIKYLGLNLQSNLKWNTHVNSLSKKIAPLAGILYKLCRNTPEHLLKSIYFAHIHSKLSYLSPVWGSASPQYAIQELQIIQNKAIRNIFYKDYYIDKLHTNEILKKYKILNVSQIMQFDTTVFFYKIANKLIKTDFNTTRNSDLHDYPTRSRTNIHTTRYNTNFGMFNVYYRGARLYNQLTIALRETPSLNMFKKSLRNHVLDTAVG